MPDGRMPQHRAREVYGLRGQIAALAEEAAELAAACCRFLNEKGDLEAVREEAVGVENVVMSLVHDLGGAGDWTLTRRVQRMKLEATLAEVEDVVRCPDDGQVVPPDDECPVCGWMLPDVGVKPRG